MKKLTRTKVNCSRFEVLVFCSARMALLTSSWLFDILAVLIGALALLYWKVTQIYTYWDDKCFKTVPGFNYITGHLKDVILRRESISDWLDRLYKSTSDPFIGIYSILRPVLLVRDPELIKSIIIKDFAYFTDRMQTLEIFLF